MKILGGRYQPTQFYLRAGFSSPLQAPFFLICAGDSAGAGYRPRVMPRPAVELFFSLTSFSLLCIQFDITQLTPSILNCASLSLFSVEKHTALILYRNIQISALIFILCLECHLKILHGFLL